MDPYGSPSGSPFQPHHTRVESCQKGATMVATFGRFSVSLS